MSEEYNPQTLYDTKYADTEKWETNAEIFEDLRKRLNSVIVDIQKVRADVKVWSEGVLDSEEDDASDDYELQCVRTNLTRAIKEVNTASYNLDCFEEVRNSDFFEEGGA